jgi:hypothetical protein
MSDDEKMARRKRRWQTKKVDAITKSLLQE